MTDLSAFTDDERELLAEAPGAVLKGAIAADGSTNALAFLKEVTAGAKVFKDAQRDQNAFVKAVALAIRERTDPEADDREVPFADGAMALALKQADEAMSLLRDKADAPDAEAYGAWLITLATRVAEASKSKNGGFFSRKVAVTEAEQGFIDDLTQLVNR
ncbi:hypothetical protein [Glycomyces sp. NPDC048151]|uniref:hypothetical protein n=1 Tax=Glycomyces sp. NPDC048151 TaxID=3364002 RepID=UPI003712E09D